MTTPNFHAPGTRVTVKGHGGWPDGSSGRIAEYPAIVRNLVNDVINHQGTWLYRMHDGPSGRRYAQWVVFDKPTDDGSGDGPYREGEIDLFCLTIT